MKFPAIPRKFKEFFALGLLGMFSLSFTVFVLLSAFEQIFFVDIPYLQTLQEYQHSKELVTIVNKTDNTAEYLHHFIKDVPRYLTLPPINSSIELTPALSRGNVYYIRGNKAHFIKRDKSNSMVIYLNENWRTTTSLEDLKVDDLIFVLSNDYNYIFKIDEVLINNPNAFAPRADDTLEPKIILVGEHGTSLTVVTATLVNSVHR